MFAYPARGVVFLAMPKCASTAIENQLCDDAALSFTKGNLKHMSMAEFEQHLAPFLAQHGFPRTSYEVVCLFREPVEWLHSWWRFRSRPELQASTDPRHRNYTGDISFDQFVDAYITQSERYARVDGGSQAEFVRSRDGTLGVDRIFRYDNLEALVSYLQDRLEREVRLDRDNASPVRAMEISSDVRARLTTHLRADFEIYDNIAIRRTPPSEKLKAVLPVLGRRRERPSSRRR